MGREKLEALLGELNNALETLQREGVGAKTSTGYVLLWRTVRNLEEELYRHPVI
jgi:hypothetical protein